MIQARTARGAAQAGKWNGLGIALVLFWAAVIFVSCMLPHGMVGRWTKPPTDKILHFCSFAILGFFFALCGRRMNRLFAFALMCVFAVSIEIAQALFANGRSAELGDALAGMSGGGAGWLSEACF